MPAPLIVDISSIYNVDKPVAGILSLAGTISKSNNLAGIIPVVTNLNKPFTGKIVSEIDKIGIPYIKVKGTLSSYMEQFPEDSHILSDDPFVLSVLDKQTFWDNDDLTKYSSKDIGGVLGFPVSAMGVYSILRGNSLYNLEPLDRVMKDDAICVCQSVSKVGDLLKLCQSNDRAIPKSITKAYPDIISNARKVADNFPKNLVKLALENALIDNLPASLQSKSSERNNDQVGDTIKEIKTAQDLSTLYEMISGQETLNISYDDNKLLLSGKGERLIVNISEKLPEGNVMPLLADTVMDSSKEIIMFDSKELRRALLKSGISDFHIDDLATLAYQENNLNKNAEFEVVLEEKLRENFPLDNSNLSQFERLERLPDLKLTLMNELTERQIMYYQRIEMPVLDVVSEMENTGLKLNTAKLKAVHDKFEEMITQCDDFLSSSAGRRVNSRNRKDIEILLYDDLKLPQIKKRSTDADTITELGRKFPASKPIFNTIALAFRNVTMIEKYTSRYGDFVDENSGHIHPTINTRSTKTGRLSCKDPNLMGIPKKSREGKLIKAAFEAPNKLIIVKADYSQIELKILAHLSQEPVLLFGFRNNLDVHRATASAVFGKSYEEVTDTERNSAKAINYGLIYGMQKFSLAKEINVTPSQAENFINTYFEKMPMVKKFLDWTVEKAHQNGYVKTILGRHINIDNINSNEQKLVRAAERQATNAPMQGSAADIVKKAMADLAIIRKERGLDFKCALQVHDELIIYSTEDGLMEAKKALKEAMENAVKLRVPINVDVEMGYNLISKTIDKKENQNEYAA